MNSQFLQDLQLNRIIVNDEIFLLKINFLRNY